MRVFGPNVKSCLSCLISVTTRDDMIWNRIGGIHRGGGICSFRLRQDLEPMGAPVDGAAMFTRIYGSYTVRFPGIAALDRRVSQGIGGFSPTVWVSPSPVLDRIVWPRLSLFS